MHPHLQAQLAELRAEDLRRSGAHAHHRTAAAGGTAPADVVIRRATAADGPALTALAALDAAPLPLGPALVAEVSGSPRAVLPLDGSAAFGDPFLPTGELVALLELRADQLRREAAGSPVHRRGPLGWMAASALRAR